MTTATPEISIEILDSHTLASMNSNGDYVTLYKMTATDGFSDDSNGVAQYQSICENHGLKMVGCGTGSYYCDEHENCIPMPSSWGCNMMYRLYYTTGWNNVVALQEDGINQSLLSLF